LYGVAATLFFMLAGRMPFEAASYEDLVVQVRTQRAPSLSTFAPHLPPTVTETVDRGLARDRDARWPTALAFIAALRSAMASVAFAPTPPMRASAPPTAHTTMRTGSSSRSGWILGVSAIVGAVALVALGTLLFLYRSRASTTETLAVVTPTATVPPSPPPSSTPASSVAVVVTATPTHVPVATVATPTMTTVDVSRVAFDPPHIVGHVNTGALDALARAATPAIRHCSVHAHTVAKTNLFVQEDGEISLVTVPPENKAEPTTALCVGHAFQDAAKLGFHPVASGVVTITATLDPLQ
jgi:hypothetical protein